MSQARNFQIYMKASRGMVYWQVDREVNTLPPAWAEVGRFRTREQAEKYVQAAEDFPRLLADALKAHGGF